MIVYTVYCKYLKSFYGTVRTKIHWRSNSGTDLWISLFNANMVSLAAFERDNLTDLGTTTIYNDYSNRIFNLDWTAQAEWHVNLFLCIEYVSQLRKSTLGKLIEVWGMAK